MAIVINGSGTISGISVGGLPDGIVDNGTMADDAIAIADLAATGTASSTTYLRGDNSWQTAGSTSATDLTSGTLPTARLPTGSVLQVVRVDTTTEVSGSTAWIDVFPSDLSITAKATGSKYHFFTSMNGCNNPTSGSAFHFRLDGSQTTLLSTHFSHIAASGQGRMSFSASTVLSGTTTSGATGSYNIQFENSNGDPAITVATNGGMCSFWVMEVAG
jgi:hypothetical protein